MEITNYKLKDFIKLDANTIEETAGVLAHLKPSPTKKELFYCSLTFVDFVKRKLGKGELEPMIEIIKELQELSEAEVMDMTVVDFYGTIKAAGQQLRDLLSLEQTRLESKHGNFKWEAVEGSKRLAPFGLYNTLDNLSKGDITKWELIKNLPYDQIFTKLFMDTVRADIEEDISKIKK